MTSTYPSNLFYPIPMLESAFHRRNSNKMSVFSYHNHVLSGPYLRFLSNPIVPKDVGKMRFALVQGTRRGQMSGIRLDPNSILESVVLTHKNLPTPYVIVCSGMDAWGVQQKWQLCFSSSDEQSKWLEALKRAKEYNNVLESSGQADLLRELGNKLKLSVRGRKHLHRFRLHDNCFVSRRALRWLMSELKCSVSQAVVVGNKLLHFDIFHHLMHEHIFCAKKLIFQFQFNDTDDSGGSIEALLLKEMSSSDSNKVYSDLHRVSQELTVAKMAIASMHQKILNLNTFVKESNSYACLAESLLLRCDFLLAIFQLSTLLTCTLSLRSTTTTATVSVSMYDTWVAAVEVMQGELSNVNYRELISFAMLNYFLPVFCLAFSCIVSLPSRRGLFALCWTSGMDPPPSVETFALSDVYIPQSSEDEINGVDNERFNVDSKKRRGESYDGDEGEGEADDFEENEGDMEEGFDEDGIDEDPDDGDEEIDDAINAEIDSAIQEIDNDLEASNLTTADGDDKLLMSDEEGDKASSNTTRKANKFFRFKRLNRSIFGGPKKGAGAAVDSISDSGTIAFSTSSLASPVKGAFSLAPRRLTTIKKEESVSNLRAVVSLPPLDTWPNKVVLLRRSPSMLPSEIAAKEKQILLQPISIHKPVDPELSEFAIESDYFVGKAYVIIADLPDSPASYFRKKQRKFQAVIQGRFKKSLPFSSVQTGQAFDGPIERLPSKWFTRMLLNLLSKLQPASRVCLKGSMPHIISPLVAAAQNIIVSKPGAEPSISTGMHLIEENMSLLGATFEGMSSKKRKQFFSKRMNLTKYSFCTENVYTFDMYQHLIQLSTFQLDVGLMKYDLLKVLGARPLQIMSMVWDPYTSQPLITSEDGTAPTSPAGGKASRSASFSSTSVAANYPESWPFLYNIEVWHKRSVPEVPATGSIAVSNANTNTSTNTHTSTSSGASSTANTNINSSTGASSNTVTNTGLPTPLSPVR